jgi:4-hydroxy-tetrahydrodipicolinate reductase
MKPVRILLNGCSGRMGRALEEVCAQSSDVRIEHRFRRSNFGDIEDLTGKEFDVAVDFSSPEASVRLAQRMARLGRPVVCGTTGLSGRQRAELQKTSRRIPLLYSANMSLGINTMIKMLRAAGPLVGFDVALEEIHHKKKKDRPSGTAKWLHSELETSVGRKVGAPHSVRGGGHFGFHRVLLLGEEEVLEISHTALSRTLFARGAIRAAMWMRRRAPGLYSMTDVVG